MKIQYLKKDSGSSVESNFEMDFNQTGDPFVDVGGLVLYAISQLFPHKTIMEKIEYLTDVYIDMWYQKLHSVFHTNSTVMNPSTKGEHKMNTLNYFQKLIDEASVRYCIKGYCKICGKLGILYPNTREFLPLSGSRKFVNFHHSHENGSFLCNECSIKLYFLPLGVIQLGQNIGFIHTQSEITNKYWTKEIIKKNINKISKQSSNGVLQSKYKNPKNALFHLSKTLL